MKSRILLGVSGIAAGIISGFLGTGGGMVLVGLLPLIPEFRGESLFPACVGIMLPICAVGTAVSYFSHSLIYGNAMPYLIGSLLGGLAAGLWGKRIPSLWLHRSFGALILLGGLRQLWIGLG